MMGIIYNNLKQNYRFYSLVALLFVGFTLLIAGPTSAFASNHGEDVAAAQEGFKIYALIYKFCIAIGGLFAFVGGVMLDYSIAVLVEGMGTLMRTNIGVAVDQLWVVVRDLFNIIFIFSLIFLGIQTILKSDDANTQRAIGYLIIAALLINFSLLITKTIVDFTNVTAYQITVAMSDMTANTSGGSSIPTTPGDIGTFLNEWVADHVRTNSVSSAFMDRMRLSSYAQDGQFAYSDDNIGLRTVIFGLLMMFLMIIAGFVFAAGALLLVARFVTLVFLMIFSPVLFLGWIYPGFKKHSERYWDMFLKNAFVAPAYLFMLFLSLRVFAALGEGGNTGVGHLSSAITADGGLGTGIFILVLFFTLIAGFLIGSVVVAKNMGAVGSSMAMKITQRGTAFAGGMVAGGAARMGRNIAGYGAQRVADSENLKDTASRRGVMGSLARGTLKGSRVVADSSFDVRSLGSGSLNVAGQTIDYGKGAKGGYKTQRDAVEKKEKEFAKNLGEIGDEDEVIKNFDKNIKFQEAILKEANISGDKRAQENAKDAIKQLREDRQREKNRRQIGTASDDKKASATKAVIEENVKHLNSLKRQLETMASNDPTRAGVEKDIQNTLEDIAENKKLYKEELEKLGYAGVLQNRDFFGSAYYARVMGQDRYAGKEIRKQYEKQAKQSKEDKNGASLIDAVKSSTKKDT